MPRAMARDAIKSEEEIRKDFRDRVKHMYDEMEDILEDAEETPVRDVVNKVLGSAAADVLHEMVNQCEEHLL